MTIQEKLYTPDEVWELSNLPENVNRWFELYRGILYEAPMPTPDHAPTSAKFTRFLDEHLDDRDIGYVFGDGCVFYLPNGEIYIPDTAFVSKERQPTLPLPAKFEFAPDLAVEVVSPSNSPQDIFTKVENYIACGTRLVWVAYSDDKVVKVWRPAEDGGLHVHTVDIDGTLDGGEVLPGFKLPLRKVFAS
jgi:Uma2 family endonuclease